MKNKMNKIMREHYEAEVSSLSTPPLPEFQKRNKFRVDNLFLTICAAAGLMILLQPGLNSNVMRQAVISSSTYEMLKDDFSRVIFNASQDYKNNKGVNYD